MSRKTSLVDLALWTAGSACVACLSVVLYHRIRADVRSQAVAKAQTAVPSALSKKKQGVIVIIGLGGVGSHAAHILSRSGYTNLRLVDFDLIPSTPMLGA